MGDGLISVVFNITGGILVILIFELIKFIKYTLISIEYKKLFGKDIVNNHFIVYGKMKVKELYDKNGQREKYPYIKSNGKSFNVSEIISFSQMKSAKYILEAITKHTKASSAIISDEEICDKLDVSYCSVGGLNNYKTVDILEDENNNYFYFNNKGSISIVSKVAPGIKCNIDYKYDYGLIIKLKNKKFPDRVQICVAGLGESGTNGAAWYLANKWKHILKKVKKQNFGCIIRVEHNKDESAELLHICTEGSVKKDNKL